MRIVFAGTPEFAATALRALIAARGQCHFELPLVLTQPDRPAGRGLKLAPSAVKAVALEFGLPVASPLTFSRKRDAAQADAAIETLRTARADLLVVAAYGLILPQAVLGLPAGIGDAGSGRVTAINIHASLLPRWRGAAPAARAIEAGDAATGITLMQMDAGLDTGPMLRARSLAIDATDTTATLTARLASLGAAMLVELLATAPASLRATPQPMDGVTYAHKLAKGEAMLDWREPAALLARRVRAFDPFPVAAAQVGELSLKLWRAVAESGTHAEPGTILAADRHGLRIACGEGALVVTELQRAGGKRLSAAEFLAGALLPVGARLAVPAL
jgi:methionyl-tRNA formyltransferase